MDHDHISHMKNWRCSKESSCAGGPPDGPGNLAERAWLRGKDDVPQMVQVPYAYELTRILAATASWPHGGWF